jgi:uroporphyrinogen-III synthase
MTPNLLLQGLRVLVTRPRQQAPKWQDCLQNEGASTLVARLLEVVPFDSDNSDDRAKVTYKITFMHVS